MAHPRIKNPGVDEDQLLIKKVASELITKYMDMPLMSDISDISEQLPISIPGILPIELLELDPPIFIGMGPIELESELFVVVPLDPSVAGISMVEFV